MASVHGTSRSTETSVYEVAGEPAESDFEAAMGKAAAEMEETGESDEEEEGKETRRVLEEELVEDSEAVGEEVDTDEEEYAELFRTGIRYSQLVRRLLPFLRRRLAYLSSSRRSNSFASSRRTSHRQPAFLTLRRPPSSTRSGRQRTSNPASPSVPPPTKLKPRTPPTPPDPRTLLSPTSRSMARRSQTRARSQRNSA